MCVNGHRGQKKMLNLFGVGITGGHKLSDMDLEIKLRSSRRIICALNH